MFWKKPGSWFRCAEVLEQRHLRQVAEWQVVYMLTSMYGLMPVSSSVLGLVGID